MTQESNAPLTARSVLASALLGESPPELTVAHLVHLASLFGINENRARVALSRMVAAGEATTDGSGRYRLAGHLLDRQQRQQASRAGAAREWDGVWHQVVVVSSGHRAEVRGDRRKALRFARLAELREGVWMRPANLDIALPEAVVEQLMILQARPGDAFSLARSLWDLEAWSARASHLLAELDGLAPRDWTDLAPGFLLSASVLRHLQADPLLPAALLPSGWPGQALRSTYDAWDTRYRDVLAQWGRRGGRDPLTQRA